MTSSHTSLPEANSFPNSPMARLLSFLDARRTEGTPVEDLEAFERELHSLFAAAEGEAMAHELARFDINVPVVVIGGVPHRQVLRCAQTYLGSAGEIRVERSLYSTREAGERAVCPMELRAGIVEGHWTPLAARQAALAVTHLTPQEAEGLFASLGSMRPSKSSLDRLPKQLSARWEEARRRFEEELRMPEEVPPEAVAIAISLDGVLVPMKDGNRQKKRAEAARAGKRTKGPAGYEEVGCGTVTLYDASGARLRTIRIARMPEERKATLKSMLTAEFTAILKKRPDLQIVKLADGAHDNWTYLHGLPKGEEIVDFYHAAEHLNAAMIAAYGETSQIRVLQFERLRHILRHDPKGADKVIRSLRHLRDSHPRSKALNTELGYFRRNRRRMRYAILADKNLPIGSGVTEAACKTLASQRLKRSGMRWRHHGGQAILTLRSLVQSDRFEQSWTLLAATYIQHVELPAKVAALRRAA